LESFGAKRETDIDEFIPITGYESTAVAERKRIEAEIARLEKDYARSINPAEKGRMVTSDVYDAQVGQSGDISEGIRRKN